MPQLGAMYIGDNINLFVQPTLSIQLLLSFQEFVLHRFDVMQAHESPNTPFTTLFTSSHKVLQDFALPYYTIIVEITLKFTFALTILLQLSIISAPRPSKLI